MRSTLRKSGPPRNTKRVCSCNNTLLLDVSQSASTSSLPSSGPPSAATIDRCRMVPIFGASCGLIASELFQEINSIDVLVVEPHAHVMRMIDTFVRARLERIAASDDRAVGRAQRIKHGLRQPVGPDVGRERLAVDGNVDAAGFLVNGNGDAVTRMWPGRTKQRRQQR